VHGSLEEMDEQLGQVVRETVAKKGG